MLPDYGTKDYSCYKSRKFTVSAMKKIKFNSREQSDNFEWQKLSWPTEYFCVYEKIYLANLEDEALLNFYKCFNGRRPIIPLSPDNFDSALHEKKSLLIYVEDTFPPCNKISVYELWDKFLAEKIAHLIKFCYINSDPAIIRQEELSAKKLIQKFDDNAFSVVITDDQENLAGTVTRGDFISDFPRKNFSAHRELFLNFSKDESKIKISMAKKFLSESVLELPIVKNGKVLSSCKIAKTFLLRNCEENFPPVYWETISDEVAADFFKDKRRILISSTFGSLKGFVERFKNLLDIREFDDTTPNFSFDEFDFLIHGADVWRSVHLTKLNVQKLYANLFAEELRRYLAKNGVRYFYLEFPEEFQEKNFLRTRYSERTAIAPLTFGSFEKDYFVHSDKFSSKWTTISGLRLTYDTPKNFERTISLFGACSVVGTFVDDAHTIATLLQKNLNENSLSVKVVNCGNNGGFLGATINELYRIADTPFQSGDVIIHVNSDAWQYCFKENLSDRFFVDDIFDRNGNKRSKPFRDTKSGHHINEDGSRLIADFLIEKIQALPKNTNPIGVAPFFLVRAGTERLSKNFELKNFLSVLKKEKVTAQTAGAIVMNCNPFTLGHRYLIEKSLQATDFLYIFIVEEDCSEFSFHDRFTLAKNCCADLKKIKILPSGKYVISLLTFADYFQKENFQGQETIAPVSDIKLFGQEIAPILGIKKRFVGEEPFDSVTRKYNEMLKLLLPVFGVETVELPRLRTKSGEVITASAVRNLIREGKIKDCKKFLPSITYDFIIKNFQEGKSLCFT